ncbi:hypothetical protein QAD02_015743 [Eretmocerus hayati]|uniref:Uncharacterized protein n=1 Tax=Eretmocerus hayati TaxID=131215 RepID=A0ACC2P940_9HYME|nr:hypothetical protein QAD02_015743 [Eretmocerus hayati]
MGSVCSAKLPKMTVTKDTIKQLIDSDKVVIFSKSGCPFCKMAKEKFDLLKQAYKAIEIDEKDDCDQYQDILEEITGARTVPRVFIKGEFVGGGTDIKKLYESGDLAKKLE